MEKQEFFDIFTMAIQASIDIQKGFDHYIMTYPEIQVQFQVLSVFEKQQRFEAL